MFVNFILNLNQRRLASYATLGVGRLKKQLFSIFLCLFLVISSTCVLIGSSQTSVSEGIIEVELPVRGTFLKTMDDWPYYGPGEYDYNEDLEMDVGVQTDFRVENPVVLDLQANGLNEKDRIYVSWTGGFYVSGAWYPDNPEQSGFNLTENDKIPYGGLLGVFSTSSELLGIDELNRVPGAIDYGEDYETSDTWWSEGRTRVAEKLESKGIDWYDGPIDTDIPEDFLISPYTGMGIEIPRNARFFFICVMEAYYNDNFEGPNPLIVTIEKDTDWDGLPDSWEINGIDVDKDGEIDLNLQALDADYEHKDVFIEIDYMIGHRPKQEAIDDVVKAFREAPVSNPDEREGINLHVIVDESVPFRENLTSWDEYKTIKLGSFGAQEDRSNRKIVLAKALVFKYCLSANKMSFLWRPDIPGLSEGMPSDDMILAFGAFSDGIGSRNEQSAIFMHELGHCLGLHHGGNNDVNYKPNYLSIMNYAFTYDAWVPNRPLDYSRQALLTLDENNLNETKGIGVARKTVWKSPSNTLRTNDPGLPIDWNVDGNTTIGVSVNLNNYPEKDAASPPGEELEGFNDWDNLVYRSRGTRFFAASAIPEYHDELPADVIELMYEEGQNIVEVPVPEVIEYEFSEITVDVSALGTFLRADPIMEEGGSPVEEPTIIDLEAEGMADLDWVLITYSGKIFHAIDWGDGEPLEDGYINLIGLFSTTADLESIDNLNRVPGAIRSNNGFETDETYFTDLPTDIPEDFLIGHHTGTKIEIPEGAKFLFLCNPDVYYPDNFGSFQVTIKKLETEQSDSGFPLELVIITILAIIAIIILLILYKRKKKKTEIEPT